MKDVRKCSENEILSIWTNGVKKMFKEKSVLRLLPIDVHYNEDSLATILSFKDINALPGVNIEYQMKNNCFVVELRYFFFLTK